MLLENRTIAIVEDDQIMGESLVERLSLEGARVHWWPSREAALAHIGRASADAVVCDIRLPDGSGEELFQDVAAKREPPPFLFVTAYGDIDQAVRLMRAGAGDYLTKPFDMKVFLSRLQQLLRPLQERGTPVLGVSDQMRALERLLQKVAPMSSPVLLVGETGAGKEVCAKLLHDLAGPDTGPFMAVNCAAIPSELMESELFGHEKGAFSGAVGRHLGYAERAARGALFLDEIAELDPKLQTKLLRLIEERSFHRVGGEQHVPFRARLICATNANLEQRVREGRFREDLLYRINVVTIPVPPLRDRIDDIGWLAERFLIQLGPSTQAPRGLSALAIEELEAHDWPGNVRELRNRLERAGALAPGPWIMPGDLFPERRQEAMAERRVESLESVRDEAERQQIIRALRRNGGAVMIAAKALGISRTTMWEKMRRHGIDPSQAS